ncbi:hypothetical protein PMG11_02372 [Penicillium brasilianum]|uniref:C2H2-type domain-containing protein n=1 Tax=Penicillium brasilianum TaxID=104259 RepID=A0A0F7TJS3_PENBI|nr:hypothetical protein PMG11_02372 [Penicillium brasilianum]
MKLFRPLYHYPLPPYSKFICPKNDCGWIFKCYPSYLYHLESFHPGAPFIEPKYQAFIPGYANDPAEREAPLSEQTNAEGASVERDQTNSEGTNIEQDAVP